MGYVYIRSTPSTLEFLPRFIKRLIDVKDDQRAFNLVLKYGLHLTWNKVGCLCLCHVEEVRPARSLAAPPSLGARRECTAKQAQGGMQGEAPLLFLWDDRGVVVGGRPATAAPASPDTQRHAQGCSLT